MGKSFDSLTTKSKLFDCLPGIWFEETGVPFPLVETKVRLQSVQDNPLKPNNWLEMVKAASAEQEIPQAEYLSMPDWQKGGNFTKPGIGDRETAWPSFSSDPIHGTANPTCATCGGRLRGKKKCSCEQPHDHWKPLGASKKASEEHILVAQPVVSRASQAHGMQAWHEGWLRECFRVLRPGGVIKAFSATRTQHRLAAAMEAVGFVLDPKESLEAWAYGCLSADTEILTQDGWKPGLTVEAGELVSCWDPKTDTSMFYAVERVTRAPFKGSLVRLTGEGTDQLLTPNHRVYHKTPEGEGWEVTRADALLGVTVEVPLDAGKTTQASGELVSYDGMVWCVKVPTGAFFARRGNQVFRSGNSGFPKSLNVSKALEKMGNTEAAKVFAGIGTAIKPSWEPFLVGRKPIKII